MASGILVEVVIHQTVSLFEVGMVMTLKAMKITQCRRFLDQRISPWAAHFFLSSSL